MRFFRFIPILLLALPILWLADQVGVPWSSSGANTTPAILERIMRFFRFIPILLLVSALGCHSSPKSEPLPPTITAAQSTQRIVDASVEADKQLVHAQSAILLPNPMATGAIGNAKRLIGTIPPEAKKLDKDFTAQAEELAAYRDSRMAFFVVVFMFAGAGAGAFFGLKKAGIGGALGYGAAVLAGEVLAWRFLSRLESRAEFFIPIMLACGLGLVLLWLTRRYHFAVIPGLRWTTKLKGMGRKR